MSIGTTVIELREFKQQKNMDKIVTLSPSAVGSATGKYFVMLSTLHQSHRFLLELRSYHVVHKHMILTLAGERCGCPKEIH